MVPIFRQDPQNISIILTFGGHNYTSGFQKQLKEAIFETTREYRYLNYIVHLIGDVLIVSGRIEHGECPAYYTQEEYNVLSNCFIVFLE
jgi:hypothetical protein